MDDELDGLGREPRAIVRPGVLGWQVFHEQISQAVQHVVRSPSSLRHVRQATLCELVDHAQHSERRRVP